ncbi:MAG: VaFE repeat-containing surface-anchored protein [Lachnospiraceae bacterium]|nr:VaFE repeat-containing surface-anchored protein [Lachnospiraceae bacterium]
MNSVKCKKTMAVLLAFVFIIGILKPIPPINVKASEDEQNAFDNTEEEDDITEEEIIENTEDISLFDDDLDGSGDYGKELNRQNTIIGINTYIDGNMYSSFNEGLLRFQWDTVYCFDLTKRFKETDNYSYHSGRPDIFTQDEQDTIALIIYYFHNIEPSLDDRPVVQYYYSQCCVWNYIHDRHPDYNPYTAYIQYSESQTGLTVTKDNSAQQEIYNKCLSWINENRENFTTSMKYWINNDGDYQPVLSTSVTPIERKGKLAIIKTSANAANTAGNNNYSLQGAVYGVYNSQSDASSNTNPITTITTDKNGKGESIELSYGTYYVKEVTASRGYSLDKKIYTATISSTVRTASVSSVETPDYDTAVVLAVKKDQENNLPLNNCVFEVKYYAAESENTISSTTLKRKWYIKTDSDGLAKLNSAYKMSYKGNSSDEFYYDGSGNPVLPLGFITIQEVEAPEGYVLNNTVYKYRVTSDTDDNTVINERIITNTPIRQSFQIMKLADDGKSELKPLANAGFMAWRLDELERDSDGKYIFNEDMAVNLAQNGSKEMFSDENGYALSAELIYGTYIVKETTVPKSYMPVDNFYVTISEDSRIPQTIRYETDKIQKFYLKLTKIDATTNNVILNNSSTYKIWSYDEDKYLSFRTYTGSKYENVSEFSTGADGILILPEFLVYGNYRLDEISAPKGYIVDTPEGIDFVIDENTVYEAYEESDDTSVIGVVHIEVRDTTVYAELEINKTGEIREFDEDSEEFISYEKPLENIEFSIYAAEDIYAYDGTAKILYKEGDIVGTITTDVEGNARLDNIPIGKYIVREEYAPEDFIRMDDKDIEFTLDNVVYEDDRTYVYEKLEITNAAYYPKLETMAVDTATNGHTGVIGENVTIVDKVDLEDLLIGRTYIVKGILYDKSTGEELLLSGDTVTGYSEIIPEHSEESVDVIFNFDASELAGKSVVCFEYLYLIDEEGNEILAAEHTDINYEGQTISFEPPLSEPPENEPPTPEPPATPTPPATKTGDSSIVTFMILLFFLSISALMSVIIIKKNKKKQ